MKKYLLFILSLLILSGCSNTSAATETSANTSESSSRTQASSQTTTSILFQTTAPVLTEDSTEETSGRPPETSLIVTDSNPSAIAQTAESLIGIPFADGGASPSEGFDNSGFIYYVLRENGYVNCPRQISEQIQWGENTAYDNVKPGDIVYFSAEPGGTASFGGVYVGENEMIYSPSPGESVKRADISTTYWQTRFAAALSL